MKLRELKKRKKIVLHREIRKGFIEVGALELGLNMWAKYR